MGRHHTDVSRAVPLNQNKKYRPRLELLEGRALLTTFTVTTTSDGGAGSLRDAIGAANASPGADIIDFKIGSGPQSIAPISPLPQVTDALTIDGTTQPGYAGSPIIELNGASAGQNANGLVISAPNCTVRGLVINRFPGDGITLSNTGQDVIQGNYIGTDPTGTVALGNGQNGVSLTNGRGNTIGGTTAEARNIIVNNGLTGIAIFGGSNGNFVKGNSIGIDAAGNLAGNNSYGVLISGARSNVIGGTTPAEGNVISGNSADGVVISSGDGNLIQGNAIGTDATHTASLGNIGNGVTIYTSGNTIGGASPSAGNTIAFNRGSGVLAVGRGNAILSDLIYSNTGQQITLFTFQPAPDLAQAYQSGTNTIVEGTLSGSPSTTYPLQFFSSAVSGPNGSGQGQVLLDTIPVTTDRNGTADFTLPLPAVKLGQFISATSTDPDNTTSQFSNAVPVATGPAVDLVITKSGSPNPVGAGTNLTYTLVVANNGPGSATGVRVIDTLPPNVTFSSGTSSTGGAVTAANGTVTADLGTLDPGQQATITLVVTPTRAGTITNTAAVTANETDTNPSDNKASLDTMVLANTVPPQVVDQSLILSRSRRSISDIVLTFSEPLDPVSAQDLLNYNLRAAGRDQTFNTRDDVIIPLASATYSAADKTVRLTPRTPLALGKLYELKVNGPGAPGLTDLAGNLLTGSVVAGNIPGLPNGVYVTFVGRGTHLRPDANPFLLGLPQFNLPFSNAIRHSGVRLPLQINTALTRSLRRG
jgi:uncharacterized repeat protein (TIGR01451 family)